MIVFELDKVTNHSWAYLDGVFNEDELKHILEIGKSLDLKRGGVVIPNGQPDVTNHRTNLTGWIENNEENLWIYNRIRDAIAHINNLYFNFDVIALETIQFSEYNSTNSHYKQHIDASGLLTITRKLTAVIFLNDSAEFQGGTLNLWQGDEPTVLSSKAGTGIFFPSYTVHEVTPVTKGTRYSLVAWIVGPKFK